jgi:hypothetical protein
MDTNLVPIWKSRFQSQILLLVTLAALRLRTALDPYPAVARSKMSRLSSERSSCFDLTGSDAIDITDTAFPKKGVRRMRIFELSGKMSVLYDG